ncbi:hypothetical protein OAL12_00170 [Akkermansiaceae bacterium]|nr:hypothetical protein [Akkermansiaceae bacterium]
MNEPIHYFETERLMKSSCEPLPSQLFEAGTGNVTDPDIAMDCAKGDPLFRDKVMSSRKNESVPWISIWESQCINGIGHLVPEFSSSYDSLYPLRRRILRNLRFDFMDLTINDDSGPVIDLPEYGP